MIESAPLTFESPVSMPQEETAPPSEEPADLADLDDDEVSADEWLEPEALGEAPEDQSPAT